MSRKINIATVAINQIPLDFENNCSNIIQAIVNAKNNGAKIICLPELCISGYGCEDAFYNQYVIKNAQKCLEKIALYAEEVCVIVGCPKLEGSNLYNCAYVLFNREIVGCVKKQHLANDGIHYERRWFTPGEKENNIFTIGCYGIDLRFGVEICEDAWVPNRPGANMVGHDVDIIFNPSASHFAFGKAETRQRLVIDASRSLHCTYVYSNLLGNEAGRIIYDGHCLIASNGVLYAENAENCSFKDFDITYATIDLDIAKNSRTLNKYNKTETPTTNTILKYSTTSPWIFNISKATKPISPKKTSKFVEFERAAQLGLFDYMRKSHSKGFVISLSGGADSSLTTILVSDMLDNAIRQLTPSVFYKKTGMKSKEEAITCIYQSTKNSSQETLDSAEQLTKSLGVPFIKWSVESIVNQYTNMVEQALDISGGLKWSEDNIALQNIQARSRGPGVWMVANLKNALLLSTSNRSEAAVGYATMDGDTCGGLSPLAGISKEFILEYLNFIDLKGLSEYYKLIPTAELCPKYLSQTDESDLMPYPILNLIEEAAIRDKMSPEDIISIVGEKVSIEKAMEYVRKFFSLWQKNQWKRERYAPSFHFDDENLDPKSWCRWPILSGDVIC